MSKTLVIYLMAEPETPELARAAVDGGADIVELGFPFSDPLADGPVIRRAGERALARGMRTKECLDVLAAYARARRRHAADPDDVRVAPRGVRLGRFQRRRHRRRRHEPDRRRPPRRRSDPTCAASSSSRRRRPTSASASPPSRRTAGSTSSPSPARPARAASSPPRCPASSSARAGRRRRPALRRLRHLDAGARAAVAELADGIVVGSRALQVAEDGPDALREYVASLRAALDA